MILFLYKEALALFWLSTVYSRIWLQRDGGVTR